MKFSSNIVRSTSDVSDYPVNVLFRFLLILVKLTAGFSLFYYQLAPVSAGKNYIVQFYPIMLLISHFKRKAT